MPEKTAASAEPNVLLCSSSICSGSQLERQQRRQQQQLQIAAGASVASADASGNSSGNGSSSSSTGNGAGNEDGDDHQQQRNYVVEQVQQQKCHVRQFVYLDLYCAEEENN